MKWKNFSLVVFLIMVIVLTTLTEGKKGSKGKKGSSSGGGFFGRRGSSHSSSGLFGSSHSTSHSNSHSTSYSPSHSTYHSTAHSTSHSNSGFSASGGSSHSTSYSNSGFSGSGGTAQTSSSGGGGGWFSGIFGGSRPRRIHYVPIYRRNPYHSTTYYHRETNNYNTASRDSNPPTAEYNTPPAEYNATIAAESNSNYNKYLFGYSISSILRSDFYSLFNIISDASKISDDKEIDANNKTLNITTVADATTEKVFTTTDFNYGIYSAQNNVEEVDPDSKLIFENKQYDASTPTNTEDYFATNTAINIGQTNEFSKLRFEINKLIHGSPETDTEAYFVTTTAINNAQNNVEEVNPDSKLIFEKNQYDHSTPTNTEAYFETTTAISNAQKNVEEINAYSKLIFENNQYDTSTPTNTEANIITPTAKALHYDYLDYYDQ